jgi:uncharacterized protein YjlB
VEPQALRFADDGAIPNHPRFPALVYASVPGVADGPEAAEALFARNGWVAQWRSGVFPFHHFHATAHEALAVAAGGTTLQLGGPSGPVLDVRAGDVLVLPAGTGHRRLGSDEGLLVVGAYPPGQDWDLRRGDPAEHDEVAARIARVADPASDPVTGGAIWGRASAPAT